MNAMAHHTVLVSRHWKGSPRVPLCSLSTAEPCSPLQPQLQARRPIRGVLAMNRPMIPIHEGSPSFAPPLLLCVNPPPSRQGSRKTRRQPEPGPRPQASPLPVSIDSSSSSSQGELRLRRKYFGEPAAQEGQGVGRRTCGEEVDQGEETQGQQVVQAD